MENLQKADDAFDGFDLTDLEDDSGAFDLSRGVWRQGPWQELDALRKKLEVRTHARAACVEGIVLDLDTGFRVWGGVSLEKGWPAWARGPPRLLLCALFGFTLSPGLSRGGFPAAPLPSPLPSPQNLRELRDLVRNLGRATGRGPLRRAPRQIPKRGAPMGVIRTPESAEETRGLTRSDDISRMLPSEAQLLAASKPGPGRQGVKAARLLHYARRLERNLLTYERVGWSDVPAQTRGGTVRAPLRYDPLA